MLVDAVGRRALESWRRRRLPEVFAAAVWLLSAIALWHRLPYGVSNRDEAFYSAMPYSFLLGNRPYVDELAMHQNAGLLLVPFFRAYLAIVGSADGIILFNRHLYFAWVCVCSFMTYRFVSRISSSAFGCLVAALVIPFSYFAIFALSYNTCGAFGFFCGILATATALLGPRPGKQLFGASLWFLAGVFAYPGFAPALLLYVLLVIYWLYREREREDLYSGLWGLAAGLAAFLVVLLPLLFWLGRSGVERLLAFSRSMGYVSGNIFAKFNPVTSGVWFWHWGVVAFACAFVALPVACRLLQRSAWVLPPVLFVLAWYLCSLSERLTFTKGVALCLLTLPVMTPVCVALNRQWQYGRFILCLVWAPSLLSMVCVVYSSANGIISASLGSLGTTVAAVVSFQALQSSLAQKNPKYSWPWFEVISACFAGLLIAQHLDNIYAGCYDAEVVFSAHDTRVRSGPFRGVLATRGEAARLESIDRDLKSVQSQGASLTIFDDFPTGYLSTRLQPRTFSQWIVWDMADPYARAITNETFGSPDRLPDFVLELTLVNAAQGFWSPYFRGRYSPVINRPEFGYVIMKRDRRPRRHRR